MAEHDVFEARLRAALVRHVADGPTDFDALGFARQVAAKEPRRRGLLAALAWRSVTVPRLAWVLLAAGLLLALVVGSAIVGARRPDHAVVIAPSATPSPTATTAPDEGTDILATTKARPLPAPTTCPPGSTPDALGAVNQERPSAHDAGAMAFDRHAGRIILLAYDDYKSVQRDPYVWAARTWTYDVCTNTWRRMNPGEEPGLGSALVYDADSDRTLALDPWGQFWSYDLATARWTKGGWLPDTWNEARAVYHDPSGLVIVYNSGTMWAYDVEADTTTKVRQRPDPARAAGSGLPEGPVAFGYDAGHDLVVAVVARTSEGPGETWTFDLGTGTWRLEGPPAASDLAWSGCGNWTGSITWGGRAVFDEATGLTVFMDCLVRRVEAYDAGQRTWRTLYLLNDGHGADVRRPTWCFSKPPVYDPLNARIVCRGGEDWMSDGVSAFSTATGQWRWLLEPLPSPSP